MTKSLTAGSMFSGIGGFCLGFKPYEVKTIWAIENDVAAVKTYKNNFNETRIYDEDIKGINVKSHGLEPVDILHAGFPCQSFSIAGEKKGFEDERGKLFYEIIRIVKEFGKNKPSVLLLENSPFLKIGNNGNWFLEVQKEIKKLGYWLNSNNAFELDTFDYTSLPQKRKRLFILAFSISDFKNGKIKPISLNNENKSIKSFVDFSSKHNESYYLDENNKYYKLIKSKVDDIFSLYQLRKYEVRVQKRNVCPTLTANMGRGGHNVPFIYTSDKKIRKLTEYECARLQGFPEDFEFPPSISKGARYTQVGNAVSVPMIEKLAEVIVNKINLERRSK